MQIDNFPIDNILPALTLAFEDHHTLILQAEPGAGKTTRVPLALMGQSYIDGKILLLEPRRVAARSAAEYMAHSLGEPIGRRVGYSMRFDRRISSDTQVEVITEGLLTQRLMHDPELAGVSLVIFDEFHERSLHTDLGLALCREVAALRDKPLRLLVMSATLDTEKLSQQLDGAPVLKSPGRTFPVEIQRAKGPVTRFELMDALERRCCEVLGIEGDVLVFLPGRSEIQQLQRRLEERWRDRDDLSLTPLYSGVSDASLNALFKPAPPGTQRFILATTIAQTSITLPTISCVIDSGLERRPRYDMRLGISRLETQRVSAATATQRAGRAGRVRAGICYQLWSDEQQRQLVEYDRAQIAEVDLSDTLLMLLNWGVHQINDLEWIEAPSVTLWRAALEHLAALGAIEWRDDRPNLTAAGKRMSQIPVDARVACLLLAAEALGAVRLGANLAALLSDSPPRATADIGQALERLGSDLRLKQLADRYASFIAAPVQNQVDVAELLLPAYADRVAQRIDAAEGRFKLSNGTGLRLDPTDPLCRYNYLICLELGGRDDQPEVQLRLGAPVTLAQIKSSLTTQITRLEELRWEGDYLRAVEVHTLGKLDLERCESRQVSPSARAAAWCARLRKEGLDLLPGWRELGPWLARVRYLALHQARAGETLSLPALDDTALLARAEEWLTDVLGEIKQRSELSKIDLKNQLMQILPWQLTQWLELYTPSSYTAPSGRKLPIDYRPEIPTLSVKLQEMFGAQQTPTTGVGLPIRVEMLSPAGRPLAITTDLAHFWSHTYPEVRKENRGRYSKHPWPEDPMQALASHLTNAALRRKTPE